MDMVAGPCWFTDGKAELVFAMYDDGGIDDSHNPTETFLCDLTRDVCAVRHTPLMSIHHIEHGVGTGAVTAGVLKQAMAGGQERISVRRSPVTYSSACYSIVWHSETAALILLWLDLDDTVARTCCDQTTVHFQRPAPYDDGESLKHRTSVYVQILSLDTTSLCTAYFPVDWTFSPSSSLLPSSRNDATRDQLLFPFKTIYRCLENLTRVSVADVVVE